MSSDQSGDADWALCTISSRINIQSIGAVPIIIIILLMLLLEWRVPIDCVWDLNSLVTANISSHFLKKVTDSIYLHHDIFCLGIDFEFRTKVKMTNPFNFSFFFSFEVKSLPFILWLVQAGWIVIVFLQALVSLLQMDCLVDLNLSSSQEMKLHYFTELCYLSTHLP